MPLRLSIKDHWQEQRLFGRRAISAAVLVFMALALVAGRLIVLQVINYEHYQDLSHGNRARIEPLPPTRGLIFDRNGRLLAENLPTFDLEITPEAVPDLKATLAELGHIVEITPEDRTRFEKSLRTHRRFDALAIRYHLSEEEVARFAVVRQQFPGVDISARLARHYPGVGSAVHAIGYVGQISEDDLDRLDRTAYAGTVLTGKIGVELAYESLLHGKPGYRQVLVDAQGRALDVLEKTPPVPGHDLLLTIDSDVQRAAERALDGLRGAAVAVDPRNGDIIALASTPTFDPNPFSGGLSPREFAALNSDPTKPMLNRALRGAYPPGSTVKPLMALAGLEYGAIVPSQTRYCRGYFTLPGNTRHFRDFKKEGHGAMNMHDAIEQSCDVYFYQVALELGIEHMHDFMSSFGLGKPSGIDIAGERSGLMPSPAWKQQAFSNPADRVWFPGQTLNTGIGQGFLLATPIQLADAAATIAAHGQRFRPRLVAASRDPVTGQVAERTPEPLPAVELTDPKMWDEVIEGMEAVVNGEHGTARRIGLDAPYRIAGKTGTAQVFTIGQNEKYDAEDTPEELRDHAWFIAFAPVEAPQLAVAVLVENGGFGSRAAAPVARQVFDAYFESERLRLARKPTEPSAGSAR
jgi:penicillin-binding protein 2